MKQNENKHVKRKAKADIFAGNNKYEKNIFKKFGRWFKGLDTWKKIVFIVASLMILVTIVLGAGYFYLNSKLDLMSKVNVDERKLSIVDVDGYANILLLGVDTRDMKNIKGSRSDAIMMISINEKTKDVKLMSIYRDTYFKMGDDASYDKITHACVYGGPEMTVKSINQALDLNISKFVVVNFKSVADLVDAVGGIEVNVEDYEIGQLNKYTIQTANNIGKKNYNLVKQAGVQNIEGVQAVSYGRIRKGVGDDYKRTERMQLVLTKVFEKMKTTSVSNLNKIANMMMPQIQTNLSNNDIITLALQLPSFTIGKNIGFPYDKLGAMINGVSYVLPDNLGANTVRLHEELFDQVGYQLSGTALNISNTIASNYNAAMSAPKPSTSTDKKPEKPVKPTKPVKPVEPVEPSEPVTPTEPEVPPTEPTEPVVPPTEPTEPTTPSTDSGTVNSGN